MPGPGGGARGGGGSRGGFGGGGFGGGGGFRGGGFHRPPFGGFYGGWHWGPRFYGGGGCLGGLLGMLLGPIFLIFMAVSVLFSGIGTAFTSVSRGGQYRYDENVFQDYADARYAEEFGRSSAYEDNILLVFLAEDEDYYDYCYIAWVGDHIATDINAMFGSDGTALGQAIAACVNESSYKYSLDSNLAQVVETMENRIVARGMTLSFACQEEHVQVKSHLTNRADIPLTEETVNRALESFTEATGIPIVLVVDDIEDVFEERVSGQSAFTVVIALVLIALALWLIVRGVRRKRNESEEGY